MSNAYSPSPMVPPDWLPPSMSEPPARAREPWKTLRAAVEKLERVRVQAAQYDAEAARLRQELGAVKARDSEALGRALANREPGPSRKHPPSSARSSATCSAECRCSPRSPRSRSACPP